MKLLLFLAGVAVVIAYQANAVMVVQQTQPDPNRDSSSGANHYGIDQLVNEDVAGNGFTLQATSNGQVAGFADEIAALPINSHGTQLAEVLLFTGLILAPIVGFVVSQIISYAVLRRRLSHELAHTAPDLEGAWWNRDWYLSSLATTAKVFVSTGLISREQADTIVGAAARSTREKQLVVLPAKKMLPTATLPVEESTVSSQNPEVL
jgi:hypothetical protein